MKTIILSLNFLLILSPAFGDIYIENFAYPDSLDITDQAAVFAYFDLHKRADPTETMY